MNVIKIVVNELPEGYKDKKSTVEIEVYASYINGTNKYTTEYYHGFIDSPLVVEEVCEWVMRSNGIAENPHNNIITLSADGIERATFCPTCGKRIKYVEVE